jgi:hypothetical protein
MQFVVFNSHIEVFTEAGCAFIPFGWWVRPGLTAAEYVAHVFDDVFHPHELMPEEDRDTMELCREAVLEIVHEDEAQVLAGASFGDDEWEVAEVVSRVGVVHNMMEVA